MLPVEICLKGDRVEIYRRGDETILRELPPKRAFRELIKERRREPGPGVSPATLMAETKREIAAMRPGKARKRARKK